MEDYEYLKENCINQSLSSLNITDFKELIDKKFKKRKEKKELIKDFIDIKKKEANKLETEIIDKCNDKQLLISIKNYYYGINQLGTFNVKYFVNKLKQFDNYIKYLKGINFKLDIDESIDELKDLKLKLENHKYFNLFNEEINDINLIIKKLKASSIDNFDEDYFRNASKNLLRRVKIKAQSYKKGDIIYEPIKSDKKETKIIENKEQIKEEKIIEVKTTKSKENIIKKNNNLERKLIELNNFNITKNAFKFFDYCKMRIINDKNLSGNQVIDVCNYISLLEEEFKYLFMTTFDSKDEKKVLEMILNADFLIEKKLDLIKGKQKIKKTA